MANSKFEYARQYEAATDYRLPIDNYVVVRVTPDQKQFNEFAKEHYLVRPNDKRCVDLCNKSALTVMRTFYPHILIAYGQSNQFSFVFRPFSTIFNRRQNKVVSLITSTFTSAFVYYWYKYFTTREHDLKRPPVHFTGRSILFGCHRTLVDYLRDQYELCHQRNLDNITLSAMTGEDTFVGNVRTDGAPVWSEEEAKKWVKKASKADKNERLFSEYGINYNNVPEYFKKGSTIVFDGDLMAGILLSTYKLRSNKTNKLMEKEFAELDITKQEKLFKILHTNLKDQSFWNNYGSLVSEDKFTVENTRPEYVRQFEAASEHRLLKDTFIVVRIDGQSFHKFSKEHYFLKPNDKRCLDLMNLAAHHVMDNFKDIVLAYGQSDEFSFILPPRSNLMDRSMDSISSAFTSAFTSAFVYYWHEYFATNRKLFKADPLCCPLKQIPTFDSRCVIYPTTQSIEDYLRWRQADCHINNLYNTTFYALTGEYSRYIPFDFKRYELKQLDESQVSGEFYTHQVATKRLSKTVSQDKKNILLNDYKIVYDDELEQFRRGSVLMRCKVSGHVYVQYVDLIKDTTGFWDKFYDAVK